MSLAKFIWLFGGLFFSIQISAGLLGSRALSRMFNFSFPLSVLCPFIVTTCTSVGFPGGLTNKIGHWREPNTLSIMYNKLWETLPDRQKVTILEALSANRNSSPQMFLISIVVPSCLKPSLRRKPPNWSEFITWRTPFRCTLPDLSVRGATVNRISFLKVWWNIFFFKKANVACLIVASVNDS